MKHIATVLTTGRHLKPCTMTGNWRYFAMTDALWLEVKYKVERLFGEETITRWHSEVDFDIMYSNGGAS